MLLNLWHVDAFAGRPFEGNPAAVCRLDHWLDDGILQAVAAENNLPETAYFVQKRGYYELRWFTPRCEVRLCGHATLATAFVILHILEPSRNWVRFETRQSGTLTVSRDSNEGMLAMDFPAFAPQTCANAPAALLQGLRLDTPPFAVMEANSTYLVAVENQNAVREVNPDFALLEHLHPYAVVVTAPGANCDFVSRYFAPSYGVAEDSVTGSAHCSLAPYWVQLLGKATLHARQLSARGGELWCEVAGSRVTIKGNAVLTLQGSFTL